MTTVSGSYNEPSLGEKMVTVPNKGAVAAYGSSGYEYLGSNRLLSELFAERMTQAMTELSRLLLTLQGDGDYEGAKQLTEKKGVITPTLQQDLDRLTEAQIPVEPPQQPAQEGQVGLIELHPVADRSRQAVDRHPQLTPAQRRRHPQIQLVQVRRRHVHRVLQPLGLAQPAHVVAAAGVGAGLDVHVLVGAVLAAAVARVGDVVSHALAADVVVLDLDPRREHDGGAHAGEGSAEAIPGLQQARVLKENAGKSATHP